LAFATMTERFATRAQQIRLYNLGVSSQNGEVTLYDYQANEGSSHASLYADVIREIHNSKTAANPVKVVCLDDFCEANGVEYIDFLKIDTEGHELEVLRGAVKLIAKNRISLIQFEFNEMNVLPRVFLRDFYQLLRRFTFFRLAQKRLIPLGDYDSRHEIFKYQNILAISSNR